MGHNTFSPVVGHIPPLARVAAITAPDSAVTSIEQSYNGNGNSHNIHYVNFILSGPIVSVGSFT